MHKLIIHAQHFTKLLPGGYVANQHYAPAPFSTSNQSSFATGNHDEPEVAGYTLNEFNIQATHTYLFCDPEQGGAIIEKAEGSSARKECEV
ncbi:hypothetical protein [Microbulbifer sp. YPW16]|nr:hypothetical protein [Microbulbifer sp. YPW16]UHQ54003.1 hypothetical protein LVE68_10800 [Microbulbifer sp. YPW16]